MADGLVVLVCFVLGERAGIDFCSSLCSPDSNQLSKGQLAKPSPIPQAVFTQLFNYRCSICQTSERSPELGV